MWERVCREKKSEREKEGKVGDGNKSKPKRTSFDCGSSFWIEFLFYVEKLSEQTGQMLY